jgi:orotidine 5'-phosphate decarboxylase subfamily 1
MEEKRRVLASQTTMYGARTSYKNRIEQLRNPVAKKLFKIMEEKQTNIAHNPDVTDKNQFLELIDAVGPHVCLIKTHIDIITNFDWDCIEQLQALSQKHNFLIFEDRKFADIGYVSKLQYTQGIYRIAEWADMITAHLISGPSIIAGLKEGTAQKKRGLIVLPRMSAMGNFITPTYTEKTLNAVQNNADFVMGVITREKLLDDSFVHFCPGVKLQEGTDALGQTHVTPQKVIEDGVDVLIGGRGIYQSKDPQKTVQEYKKAGWGAYESMLG